MRRSGVGFAAVLVASLGALAVLRPWGGEPELPRVDAQRAPTHDLGDAVGPVWSPKGQYAAWELRGADGSSRVRLGRTFDGVIQEVIPVEPADGPEGARVSNPAWHPSPRLAFEAELPSGQPRLFFMKPAPGPGLPLLDPERFQGSASEPGLAPNGRVVAWIAEGDLYVWDRATEGPIRLTDTPAPEGAPVFSRDSSALLVTRGAPGARELVRIELATAEASVVAGGDASGGAWADEGRILYFVGDRLEVVEASGQARILAQGIVAPRDGGPRVSDDGLWVAWVRRERPSALVLGRVDGTREIAVETGLVDVGEPAVAQGFGRALVAFTARSEGRRQVYVADVTETIGPGDEDGTLLLRPGVPGRRLTRPPEDPDRN